MSEDALIRLRNLKSLKLSARELSERIGGRYTYWRDLLEGDKSFGEKAARKIEAALDLPRGWLDGDGEPPSKHPEEAMRVGLSPVAYELGLLFDMLPADDKIKRTRAYSAATAEILKVLQERGAAPTPEPAASDLVKTQHA